MRQGWISLMRYFDWPRIRTMRQAGHTAYAIAKLPGMPTKQAIMKREKSESWGNQAGNSQLPVLPKVLPVELGKDTPETRAQFVTMVSQGMPQRHAANLIGFSDRTTRGWKDNDPQFAAQVAAARSAFLFSHVSNINDHSRRDWKASAWALERADNDFRNRAPATAIQINFGGFERGRGVELPNLTHDTNVIEGETE